ncbi:MAG: carbamoyltransferase, partial [Myxococcales bacterium]|nr:carbamoyltransferase [Myxococcales bacterium]
LIPSVTHVDGGARVQTVTREQNARYYDLIRAFGEETGVPVILNTSFNIRGEPIVCTPEDALKCFFTTDLDLLYLGDFLLRKE